MPPVALNHTFLPEHVGLGPASAYAVGNALTVTSTLAVAVQPLELVTVTLYVPAIATVALVLTGFWRVLVQPPGPDHEYDVPPDELKLILCPAHKVEGVAAAVATGSPLTVMTVNALPGHDPPVIITR